MTRHNIEIHGHELEAVLEGRQHYVVIPVYEREFQVGDTVWIDHKLMPGSWGLRSAERKISCVQRLPSYATDRPEHCVVLSLVSVDSPLVGVQGEEMSSEQWDNLAVGDVVAERYPGSKPLVISHIEDLGIMTYKIATQHRELRGRKSWQLISKAQKVENLTENEEEST